MKKEGSIAEACLAYLRFLLSVTSMIYVILMAGILPLYYDAETGYQKIGSNKVALFDNWGIKIARFFVVVLIFYLVIAVCNFIWKKRGEKGKVALLINAVLDELTITDKFVVFFFITLCLSYYYTDYPDTLWMGMLGWNMGFLPMVVYMGAYFAVSRFLNERLVKVSVIGIFIVAFIVFLLGILNRYGVNPLQMEVINNHFIYSLLGTLQQMRFSLHQNHVYVCVEIGKCWGQSVGALSYMV